MTPAIQAMKAMLLDLYYPGAATDSPGSTGAAYAADFPNRKIVCTRIGGSFTWWSICVQGTPPKGLLLVMFPSSEMNTVYVDSGKAKKLKAKQDKIISDFHKELLEGTGHESVTIMPDGAVSTH